VRAPPHPPPWPVVAMALICLCLIGYLRPEILPPKPSAPS
jgi:hypothetical protein